MSLYQNGTFVLQSAVLAGRAAPVNAKKPTLLGAATGSKVLSKASIKNFVV